MQTENIIFKIDEVNITQSFDAIAQRIFRDFQLVANSNKYRLLEIEFYYHSEKKHSDNQTYQKPIQKTHGQWYFHYSGIDITIGNENSFGGILIRSIGKLDNDKSTGFEAICGPLKVKDEILNNFTLVTGNQRFPFLEETIDSFSFDEKIDLKKTSRVGIDVNKEKYKEEYRYVLFEKEFPKTYRPKISV